MEIVFTAISNYSAHKWSECAYSLQICCICGMKIRRYLCQSEREGRSGSGRGTAKWKRGRRGVEEGWKWTVKWSGARRSGLMSFYCIKICSNCNGSTKNAVSISGYPAKVVFRPAHTNTLAHGARSHSAQLCTKTDQTTTTTAAPHCSTIRIAHNGSSNMQLIFNLSRPNGNSE